MLLFSHLPLFFFFPRDGLERETRKDQASLAVKCLDNGIFFFYYKYFKQFTSIYTVVVVVVAVDPFIFVSMSKCVTVSKAFKLDTHGRDKLAIARFNYLQF